MKQLLVAIGLVAILAGCGGGASGGSTAPPGGAPSSATPSPTPSSAGLGVTITINRPLPTPTPFLVPAYPNQAPLILARTSPATIAVFSAQTGLTATTSNAACASVTSTPPPSGFPYAVTVTATTGAAPVCLAIITISVGTQSDQAYVLVP